MPVIICRKSNACLTCEKSEETSGERRRYGDVCVLVVGVGEGSERALVTFGGDDAVFGGILTTFGNG